MSIERQSAVGPGSKSGASNRQSEDVSGWNAFDAPTRAWLAARLRAGGLVDGIGRQIVLPDALEAVRRALAAGDAPTIARLTRLAPDAVRAIERAA